MNVYAPKQSGSGKIEIQVDGQSQGMADLSTTGARQPQQAVSQLMGLTAGNHSISIVNRARSGGGRRHRRPAIVGSSYRAVKNDHTSAGTQLQGQVVEQVLGGVAHEL